VVKYTYTIPWILWFPGIWLRKRHLISSISRSESSISSSSSHIMHGSCLSRYASDTFPETWKSTRSFGWLECYLLMGELIPKDESENVFVPMDTTSTFQGAFTFKLRELLIRGSYNTPLEHTPTNPPREL